MAKLEGEMRSPRKKTSRFSHYTHPLLSEAVIHHAAHALGRGFDVTTDFRLGSVKGAQGSYLVVVDNENKQDLMTPTGLVIQKISKDIRLDKGERTRFQSDVMSFTQMSVRFNEGASLRGRIPLGLFNTMYGFNGSWQANESATKSLALDGWFLTLYSLKLTQSPLRLIDEVKIAVPNTWEPKALASFIQRYGTHLIVGVKVGGKNVIYVRQYRSSQLPPTQIAKLIQHYADRQFDGTAGPPRNPPADTSATFNLMEKTQKERVSHPHKKTTSSVSLETAPSRNIIKLKVNDDVEIISRRRGGDDTVENHHAWMGTVADSPDVIGMSFVPIASLLDGVTGVGFLSHAINLYLRYRPPLEELEYFLEFQVSKQWSPRHELSLATSQERSKPPSLQFSLMGPKLYTSPIQVSVGRKPVTGMRLALEGKKFNLLAIHLQYLSTLPVALRPSWDTHVSVGTPVWKEADRQDRRWLEPVLWKNFSHVNTSPIELSESWIGDATGTFIVTGAQLQVFDVGAKKRVLFMRLLYIKVPGCSIRRSLWDHTPATAEKSGMLFNLGLSGPIHTPSHIPENSVYINQDSGIYPNGPKNFVEDPKLLKFVDTSEMSKGPQDMPGHWLVSGAKLDVETGKIAVRVKYSLLHYRGGAAAASSFRH